MRYPRRFGHFGFQIFSSSGRLCELGNFSRHFLTLMMLMQRGVPGALLLKGGAQGVSNYWRTVSHVVLPVVRADVINLSVVSVRLTCMLQISPSTPHLLLSSC